MEEWRWEVQGTRDAIVVATRDVPRLQTAVFVVSFDAGESKTWKELHNHTLRPYHNTTSTYNGIPQRQASWFPYLPVIIDGVSSFSAVHSSARKYALDKPQPEG
jgi:hypothetical protein